MPSTTFTMTTSLTPAQVLAVLTDFGPGRADRWPNIDEAHFKVHDVGPDWAEVTEGNSIGWERERYEWNADEGRVDVRTLESNMWAPGSGWRYRIRASNGGSSVEVGLTRSATSLRGRVFGLMVPFASGTLRKQLQSVFDRQAR